MKLFALPLDDLLRAPVAGVAAALMALAPIMTGATDARLRVVEYDPGAVVALTAFVGYHVHLQFASDEHFVNLGAGDTSAIDVGAEGNHLLLKPRVPVSGTNLTIITDRRAYHFDYRALARAPRTDELTYSISFRYGSPIPAPTVTQAGDGAIEGRALDPAPAANNRNYWYCGPAALRPVYAADDGLQLQIRFAPNAELPSIYALGADGEESLVNSHVEHDTVFIHRIAPRFVLRRGRQVGCIVDRNLRALSRRADDGTVDAGTRREIREIRP